MIFKNKVKYNIYTFLSLLNKNHNYVETYNVLLQKIHENDLNLAISECVDNHFIDGVAYRKGKLKNEFYFCHSENVYITYNGHEFLKNYYDTILKLMRDLFLIIATAIITVLITNKFSVPNQDVNICDEIFSKNIICSKVCNNSK